MMDGKSSQYDNSGYAMDGRQNTGYPPVMTQPGQSYPPPQEGGHYPPPGAQGYYPPPGAQGYYPPPGAQGYPVPGQHSMAPPPQLPPNCPPGLQYLTQIDQLLVKQTVEIFEAFTGFETNNKYKVQNSLGQKIFMAKEDTDCCTRQMCGPLRPFDMTICDLTGTEVIHLYRPLNCQGCCFPCCLQTMEVHSPPGTVIGTIEQDWSLIYPRFTVKDESGEPVLRIHGPCWTCSCGGDVEFNVLAANDDTKVGMISKQWTGFAKEVFTDADNFGISFPLDLDVKVKATLLGAVFLIDFMYYEQKKKNDDN